MISGFSRPLLPHWSTPSRFFLATKSATSRRYGVSGLAYDEPLAAEVLVHPGREAGVVAAVERRAGRRGSAGARRRPPRRRCRWGRTRRRRAASPCAARTPSARGTSPPRTRCRVVVVGAAEARGHVVVQRVDGVLERLPKMPKSVEYVLPSRNRMWSGSTSRIAVGEPLVELADDGARLVRRLVHQAVARHPRRCPCSGRRSPPRCRRRGPGSGGAPRTAPGASGCPSASAGSARRAARAGR